MLFFLNAWPGIAETDPAAFTTRNQKFTVVRHAVALDLELGVNTQWFSRRGPARPDSVEFCDLRCLSAIYPAYLGIPCAESIRGIMSATNPFQVPAWAEINREQRRRERFKKTVITVVAAAVLLLVALLIEGCKTERAAMSTPVAPVGHVPAVPTTPQPKPVSQGNMLTDTGHIITVYIVKSGDTLSRIAKAHGTTVKAIEDTNGLNDDRILVGAKLKIPEA